MTRPLRIEYENAYYHIISRGDIKRFIFKNSEYKLKFLEKLDLSLTKYNVECYAYCIMDNHFHLFLRTPDANISSMMKHLNESYANWYRNKEDLQGHVFQGRFKSILIDSNNYSIKLVNYIHFNPVRSKIVINPASYEFSSLNVYLGKKIKVLKNLNVKFILEQFDHDILKAGEKYYKNLIENEGNKEIEKKIYKRFVLGNRSFLNKVDNLLKQIEINKELLPTSMNRTRYAEKIIRFLELEFNIKKKDIISKIKNNIYKKIAIYLLVKKSRMTNDEIGNIFKIKGSSVSKNFKRFLDEIEGNNELKEDIERLMSNVTV